MVIQKKINGFTVVEVGLVVLVVSIVGALGWSYYNARTANQAANASEKREAIDMVPDTLTDLKEMAVIQESALQDKSGVSVIHVELEQKTDGNLVYKLLLSDGTRLVYDAKTGMKLATETENEKPEETLPANFSGGIGFAKALAIAKAEKPSSNVYKIELELEDGVLVYSVRFTDKARVDVDAETGAVVRTKAAKTVREREDDSKDDNRNEEAEEQQERKRVESTEREGDVEKEENEVDDDDDHLSQNDDDDDEDDTSDDDRSGKDEDDDSRN